MYRASGGANHGTAEVEIVKLEKGVSLTIRNDASFIIDMNISFYEHQSTYSPNLPLRNLIYLANTLEEWLKENKRDLFSTRRIKIPTPYFVVFYNGLQKRPEYEELRLSQSFYHETETPQLELICRIYNINPHQNTTIKEKSPVLSGYTSFVEKVRTYQNENRNVDEAVDLAIEDCIREHILEDFFRKRKDEVKKVTHLDYTWEQREKLIRREEYEQGVEFGIERGIEQGIEQGIERGIEQGIERGIERGIEQGIDLKALQVYQRCLDRGMSEEDAVAISGVNPANIRDSARAREHI